MKKNLLLAFIFLLAIPLSAISSLSQLSDENICSWFDVSETPKIYIDEAYKRNLFCSQSVKSKIKCGPGQIQTSTGCNEIPANARKINATWICKIGFKKIKLTFIATGQIE